MASFRENRKIMGFTHTSAYIPEGKKAQFALFVEGLKATYMIELLDMPANDPARMALAQCNYIKVPEPSEVRKQHEATDNVVAKRLCRECIKHLEEYVTARNGLRLVEANDDELVNFASRAVAHNSMAAYLWQEVTAELEAAASPIEGKLGANS